ncbi:hypothetical protein PV05_01872 [Exophiala xenobiotica]|uniref:Uncharacterized protein n=1 Tax=Exophiala xenobiotica TaxID=348802 RepID=A0A0D2F470_9EURO|nr:uncharacterized protein PV05_01872 [Exophiala xenobiotica]KIW61790.1 hypothetical protein PV05_01872 [Exophiala xenobiotica]
MMSSRERARVNNAETASPWPDQAAKILTLTDLTSRLNFFPLAEPREFQVHEMWGLAQRLTETGRSKRQELTQNSTGIDYRHYRPIKGTDVERATRAIFKLQAKSDANDIFKRIIRTNLDVLKHMKRVCDEEEEAPRVEFFELVCLGLNQREVVDDGAFNDRYGEVARRWKEHNDWRKILEDEILLSWIAGKRLDIVARARMLVAGEEQFEELLEDYNQLREEMARLVLKISAATGGKEFLLRHKNELWDVVEER